MTHVVEYYRFLMNFTLTTISLYNGITDVCCHFLTFHVIHNSIWLTTNFRRFLCSALNKFTLWRTNYLDYKDSFDAFFSVFSRWTQFWRRVTSESQRSWEKVGCVQNITKLLLQVSEVPFTELNLSFCCQNKYLPIFLLD